MKLKTLRQRLLEYSQNDQDDQDAKQTIVSKSQAALAKKREAHNTLSQKMSALTQATRAASGDMSFSPSSAVSAYEKLTDTLQKNPSIRYASAVSRLNPRQQTQIRDINSTGFPDPLLGADIPVDKAVNVARTLTALQRRQQSQTNQILTNIEKTAKQTADAAAKKARTDQRANQQESFIITDKEQISESVNGNFQPPAMLVLKRTAIRQFPDGRRVALYTNDKLVLAFSVPYTAHEGIGAVVGTEIHNEEFDGHFINEDIQPSDAGNIPQKTVTAYKLFQVKKGAQHQGKIYPLYVDANSPVEMGKWINASSGERGKSPNKVKSKIGDLAYRPGWHSGDLPIAHHIGGKSHGDRSLPPDTREPHHVWAEVEVPADVDWQSVANSNARKDKNGKIIASTAAVTDQIPFGGHYRYKTNPNMTGNWLISGSMKVNRLLGDDEVEAINSRAGTADLPRNQPFDFAKHGFKTPKSNK